MTKRKSIQKKERNILFFLHKGAKVHFVQSLILNLKSSKSEIINLGFFAEGDDLESLIPEKTSSNFTRVFFIVVANTPNIKQLDYIVNSKEDWKLISIIADPYENEKLSIKNFKSDINFILECKKLLGKENALTIKVESLLKNPKLIWANIIKFIKFPKTRNLVSKDLLKKTEQLESEHEKIKKRVSETKKSEAEGSIIEERKAVGYLD
jgi:hypothetical protein